MHERIALVIPPSPFLADERVFPSLGILKVASNLEKYGHKVDVVDLSGMKNYKDIISQRNRQGGKGYGQCASGVPASIYFRSK